MRIDFWCMLFDQDIMSTFILIMLLDSLKNVYFDQARILDVS